MRSTTINAPSHRMRGISAAPGLPDDPGSRYAVVAAAVRVCSDRSVDLGPKNALRTVAGVREGHASALRHRLDDLFKEHAAYVARVAFRLLGRQDEVDDIVQDVFITLFRHLDSIRQAESLRAWLATTTVRMVRRRLRVRRIGFLLRGSDRDRKSVV